MSCNLFPFSVKSRACLRDLVCFADRDPFLRQALEREPHAVPYLCDRPRAWNRDEPSSRGRHCAQRPHAMITTPAAGLSLGKRKARVSPRAKVSPLGV